MNLAAKNGYLLHGAGGHLAHSCDESVATGDPCGVHPMPTHVVVEFGEQILCPGFTVCAEPWRESSPIVLTQWLMAVPIPNPQCGPGNVPIPVSPCEYGGSVACQTYPCGALPITCYALRFAQLTFGGAGPGGFSAIVLRFRYSITQTAPGGTGGCQPTDYSWLTFNGSATAAQVAGLLSGDDSNPIVLSGSFNSCSGGGFSAHNTIGKTVTVRGGP